MPDPKDPAPPPAFPETAADWRRAEAAYDTKCRFFSLQLATFERLRAQAREMAEMLESKQSTLPHDTEDGTSVNMNVDTRGKSQAVRRAVSRARREHPAQTAFYRANKTVGEIAEELGEGRPRVSSWMSADEPRPIPRRHADYLREKYRIPLSAWKNLGK